MSPDGEILAFPDGEGARRADRVITSAEGWLFGFAPSIVYALSLPVPQSHTPTQKRGCDKMCNHFATAFFLLEYSIRGLSNMCIYWFCLKTTKTRFTRELLYSPASPGPSPSEQG